jgi:hypothetical protein
MVMSGLQGWNPLCRDAGPACFSFPSRAFWMLVTFAMLSAPETNPGYH